MLSKLIMAFKAKPNSYLFS